MNQQRREAFTTVSERREPVWHPQAQDQPQQERWTVDSRDAHVGTDKPRKPSWRQILRLLAISSGLGFFAALLSAMDDSMTAHSMLLILVGALCGIGAACFGIAFWWRMFQRSWWQALCWFTLAVCLNGILFVALHPHW